MSILTHISWCPWLDYIHKCGCMCGKVVRDSFAIKQSAKSYGMRHPMRVLVANFSGFPFSAFIFWSRYRVYCIVLVVGYVQLAPIYSTKNHTLHTRHSQFNILSYFSLSPLSNDILADAFRKVSLENFCSTYRREHTVKTIWVINENINHDNWINQRAFKILPIFFFIVALAFVSIQMVDVDFVLCIHFFKIFFAHRNI